MKYTPPIGGAANDPYVDANPVTGVEGSPVPAAAIEDPQREIVNVIAAASLVPDDANVAQLLEALRAAGVFLTPEQFDNTTKAATTAFVQRAIGNLRGLSSYNVSTALTLSDIGKFVFFYGSTASQVFSFPDASTVAAGAGFFIVNQGTVPMQVAAFGGQTINFNTLSGASSAAALTLDPGDSIFFISNNGAQWNAFGWATNQQFPVDLSANGYQKLPNGLIIQWGSVTTNNSAPSAVTFPIAFPTIVPRISAGIFSATPNTFCNLNGTPPSQTGFTVGIQQYTGSYIAGTAYWIAIGY